MSPAFDSAVAIRVGQALISAGNALPQAVPLTLALVGLTACLAVAARRVVGRGGVALRLPDSPSPLIRRAAAAVAAVEYNPPLWTALGGNVGTIFGNLIMTLRGHPPLETTRTTVLLPDGGSVGLDWVARSAADATASPEVIVVVQHGLCGSAESVYIKELAHVIQRDHPSWQVVVSISRGCGDTVLTSVRGFTAARTTDLAAVIQHVRHRFPSARRVCVGFSLGSSLLGKYVGERGAAEAGLSAAVMLGPAWDFNIEGSFLNKPFGGWSANFLVHGLVRYLRRHATTLGSSIDFDRACRARNVREFDEICVVPMCGYANVEEYYADASACRVAHTIATPTLAVSAIDDPVCSVDGVQSIATIGEGLVIALTPTGGHMMWPREFGATVCTRFINAVLSADDLNPKS